MQVKASFTAEASEFEARGVKHYDDVIRDQEKQGIVEPVEQGTNNGVGKVHYLPHHEVIRVDKDTTKLRIVYDASA